MYITLFSKKLHKLHNFSESVHKNRIRDKKMPYVPFLFCTSLYCECISPDSFHIQDRKTKFDINFIVLDESLKFYNIFSVIRLSSSNTFEHHNSNLLLIHQIIPCDTSETSAPTVAVVLNNLFMLRHDIIKR